MEIFFSPFPSFLSHFIWKLKLTVFFDILHFLRIVMKLDTIVHKYLLLLYSTFGDLWAKKFFLRWLRLPKVGNLIKTAQNALKNVLPLFSSKNTYAGLLLSFCTWDMCGCNRLCEQFQLIHLWKSRGLES